MSNSPNTPPVKDPSKLADFVLFSQREFLLGISKDLSKGNVSFSQFFLLCHLAKSREQSMTDISAKMGHSTAAATGTVDRLEKLGYVERSHSVDDRRKVIVSITSKGIEFISLLRSALQARIAEAMNSEGDSPIDGFLNG